MTIPMKSAARGRRLVSAARTCTVIAMLGVSGPLAAQAPNPTAASPATATSAAPAAQKTFTQAELEQLVAPIALYPDSLLAQVLMASTYPLDIVSTERWVKKNPGLKDKALQDALQSQPWDPAVKSLAVFPQVLSMMSEKLDWTQKLGDAFLAQPKEVMATAQSLRAKAVEQGTLKDSSEQKVVTEKVESTTIIKIEPTNPEVVYVPTYNPTVVYGTWPYPAYPPYYYYPPGYVAGGAILGFTAGVIVGGALWGNMTWGGNDVDIDIDRYNNFNRTNIENKRENKNWNHNAERRGAVPYKDKAVSDRYNRGATSNAASRDAYRGRADSASRDFSGAAAGARAGGAGTQNFNRDFSSTRGGDYSGTRSSSAFDTGSRAQTRDYSNRGSSSMSSARSSAGARAGGGGGARGGGGGRGGGGRR